MLLARGAIGIALLFLWVFCIFDAITTSSERVRNLPKLLWVVIVVVLPDIGSVLWLVAGRPRRERPSRPHNGHSGPVPPEYDRPGRAVARNPDDDAAFLEHVRRRAEEQRKKAAEEAKRLRDDEERPPQA